MSQVFVQADHPARPTSSPATPSRSRARCARSPANAGQLWDLPPALASAAREGTLFVDDATVRPAAGATAQATPD
jgi:hypothetical protein